MKWMTCHRHPRYISGRTVGEAGALWKRAFLVGATPTSQTKSYNQQGTVQNMFVRLRVIYISMTNITKERAIKTLEESKNKTEWARALGFKYINGRILRILNNLIEKYDLNYHHFDLHHKKRKYKIITKNCPICNKQFKTQLDHKREKTTCSRKCSNIFFSDKRHTDEANQKRKASIIKYLKRSSKR